MDQSKEFSQEFQSLARYLSKQQDNILHDWEHSLKNDKQASKLMSLSREKFHNHVPIFLDIVCKCLYRQHESARKVAREHGAQRWEHGLDLRETIKEWGRLHQVIMNYIGSAKDEISLSFDAAEEAQKIVSKLIHDGIQNSVDEFYELQNREADAQRKDLETALTKKEFQGQNLQQTSHDLKGVLSSLQIGFSLLNGKTFDERTKEILEEMSLAADNLEQLLTNLLDLFRLEAGKEEVKVSSFDVTKALHEICESLRPLAEAKNLNLQCNGKSAFSVKGDQNKLQRIAQNLLINAIKYTDEGEVVMNWKLESEENWRLTISDTGPGLSPTYADFLTTESEEAPSDSKEKDPTGEGIGLLIVRRLCKLLNAVINVDTAPDEGTTFNIIFPLEYNPE